MTLKNKMEEELTTQEELTLKIKQLQEEYNTIKPKKKYKRRVDKYCEVELLSKLDRRTEVTDNRPKRDCDGVKRIFHFPYGEKALFGVCPFCKKRTYFELIRGEFRLIEEEETEWFWLECKRCYMICDKIPIPAPYVKKKDFVKDYTIEEGYDKSDKD